MARLRRKSDEYLDAVNRRRAFYVVMLMVVSTPLFAQSTALPPYLISISEPSFFFLVSVAIISVLVCGWLWHKDHTLLRKLQSTEAERKSLFEEMASVHQRSKSLLENAPYPLVIADFETGTIIHANALALEMLPISSSAHPDRSAADFWKDPEKYNGLISWLKYTGNVNAYEARLASRNRAYFWASISASVIELNGRPSVLIAISDISHLKEIAANLRLNQNRFHVMADAVPAAVVHVGADGIFLYANRTCRQWFGLNDDAVMHLSYNALCSYRLFQQANKVMPRLENGENIQIAQDEILADGDKRHLDTSYIPVMGEDGGLESWLMLITDVTRWKDMELRLQELALTDELTGLRNRRYLYESGGAEIIRSRRFRRPLSFILMDIDRFKLINDEHGHAAGDQTLRALAKILQKNCRATDLVARTGGEEFVILLPETHLADAVNYAEKLRMDVQASSIVTSKTVMHITLSMGVSALSDCYENLEGLMNAADKALYRAKSLGRNRVEIWNDDASSIKSI